MSFQLPDLPYPKDALAPHMSAETLEYHHGKHHQKYVETTNELVKGKPEESWSLEDLIRKSEGKLYNQAAQVWNHTFFWNCMKPGGGGEPSGAIAAAIDRDFGGYDAFRKQFADVAAAHFASGWAWLVSDGGKLKILSTPNAHNPLRDGQTPLLTLDVWEHAYYIDYRNARPKYCEEFWKLVNWDFVNKNFG